MDENALSNLIIGAAIEVHKYLGPGLLESSYEEPMGYEFVQRQLVFERQKQLPLHDAQVLTYLKLTNCKLGLLLNFNVLMMKHGIKRIALNL